MKELILLGCVLSLLITFVNLRRWRKYRTSFVPTAVSVLVFLSFVLIYIGNPYAYLLILITALIAIADLPNVWKDWVKILRDVNPREGIKPRDLLSLNLIVKLGYRYGLRRASFLYALEFSATFAICYCVIGKLLSMKNSCVVAVFVALLIFPINYRLASKTLKGLIGDIDEKYRRSFKCDS